MAHLQGAAAEHARHMFGGDVVEGESNPTVGVAAAELLGGDPERVSVVIINLSPNDIYLSWRVGVASTNGVWIGPNGGSVSFNAHEDGVLPARQMFAIAGAAASQVYIITLRRETLDEGEE